MKTILLRVFQVVLALILLIAVYAVASGKTYLFKAVIYNFAGIDDYQKFSNDTVTVAAAKPWAEGTTIKDYPDSLNQLLEKIQTVALLVIKKDSVVLEKYWDGYSDSSLSGSFSMAKSVTSVLIGAAIKDGLIGSINDPVGKYIPEFNEGKKAAVRIVDVLTMSSGTDFDESYGNPLSVTAELYYGTDVRKTATSVNMTHEPGTLHRYKSGDTQLLGLIIEKAIGKSLAAYAAEKLWQPLGAEHPALWSNDHPGGAVKAYCCFNSNARDFARIGKLMLDSGKINGVPVIDSIYFANSIKACGIKDDEGKACDYYGYQWWLDPLHPGVFYARGILGQFIIVIPAKQMVIVRLGHKTSPREERIRTVPKEVRYLVDWGVQH
jgi:CubicO group peptidase (beta-lactamase class C family)